MCNKYLLSLLGALTITQHAFAGPVEMFDSMTLNPFLEIGYAKLKHANKLRHFENTNYILLTTTDIHDYRKRSLKDSDAFYLKAGISPDTSLRYSLEYIQTNKNKLNVTTYIANRDGYDNYALSIKQKAFLMNINYHPIEWNGFSPYMGGVIGVSKNSLSEEIINLDLVTNPAPNAKRLKKSSTRFAWGVQAGVQYTLSQGLYINTQYRFIDFGAIKGSTTEYNFGNKSTEELPSNLKGHLRTHMLMVGLGYQF